MYAKPQKTEKKGKKKKVEPEAQQEEAQEQLTEEEKAALYSVPNKQKQKAAAEGVSYTRSSWPTIYAYALCLKGRLAHALPSAFQHQTPSCVHAKTTRRVAYFTLFGTAYIPTT